MFLEPVSNNFLEIHLALSPQKVPGGRISALATPLLPAFKGAVSLLTLGVLRLGVQARLNLLPVAAGPPQDNCSLFSRTGIFYIIAETPFIFLILITLSASSITLFFTHTRLPLETLNTLSAPSIISVFSSSPVTMII